MSNNKTLISLLLVVAVIAFTLVVFSPLLYLSAETTLSLFFMVVVLLFKIAGALAAGILLMLVLSDRPWRKLRHVDDITFDGYQAGAVKREPFKHVYNGHLPK
ncbi:hypothetical protein [Paraglaciecola sp. 20A4]|uniref:hypothetical protein n=1 Tax=Paraglaciecola sp. 20A4 TaxID=2687288 RepID=UPI00140BB86B|nr:hypothetical protein [Paraglaciecola sp. 20A4]